MPRELALSVDGISQALVEVCEWVESESGLVFPTPDMRVEEYENKQGTQSFQAKVAYSGPLGMAPRSLQRVKFDITQAELLADDPVRREIFHRYQDAPTPVPTIACYSVNEILAEKTRALFERRGRARDVYDVVHISRVFRDEIEPTKARRILSDKFVFKGLPEPTAEMILERLDSDTLRTNWDHQLAHQLPVLPSVEMFEAELDEALKWWMEPDDASPGLEPWRLERDESTIPPQRFPARQAQLGTSGGHAEAEWTLDRLRLAGRNRLRIELRYKGVDRIIEPYSLRRSGPGNLLFYGHEVRRGSVATDHIKAYNVPLIQGVRVTNDAYQPRWMVEL